MSGTADRNIAAGNATATDESGPRFAPSGGLWNKLGNQYEGLWSVEKMLDLLEGRIETIEFEPWNGQGIEFKVVMLDGTREYHSVKRRHPSGKWSFFELTRPTGNSASSVWDDLVRWLEADPDGKVVFVSGVSSNLDYLLGEPFCRCSSFEDFTEAFDACGRKPLQEGFLKYLANDRKPEAAYQFIRRLSCEVAGERHLETSVLVRIEYLVQRADGQVLDPHEVKLILAEQAINFMRMYLRKADLIHVLEQHGIVPSDFGSSALVADRIDAFNRNFTAPIRKTLIGGVPIPRTETKQIADAVIKGENVFLQARSGFGKSVVLMEVAEALKSEGVPFVFIKLDSLPELCTTAALGQQLGLPASPVATLAKLGGSGPKVLILDQIDAASTVSGRAPWLWTLFCALLEDAQAMGARYGIRLLLACREFDAANDPELRAVRNSSTEWKEINLQALPEDLVKTQLKGMGINVANLSAKQVEAFRIPELLYLASNIPEVVNESGGASVTALYKAFWDKKRRTIDRNRSGLNIRDCINTLTDHLSERQLLAAGGNVLDEYEAEKDALCQSGLLVETSGTLRFFHEGFFDYWFAQGFLRGTQSIRDFLLSSPQDLFRRAQVRQILSALRDGDRTRYLLELRGVLLEPNVQFHIRRVVLQWLGSVTKPSGEEWDLLVDARRTFSMRLWDALGALHESLDWFDFLAGRDELLPKWLALDPQEELASFGIYIASCRHIIEERPERVIELLRMVPKTPLGRRVILSISPYLEAWSPLLLDFYCEILREEVIAGGDVDRVVTLTRAKKAPRAAVGILSAWYDAWCHRAEMQGKRHVFEIMPRFFHGGAGWKDIVEYAPRECFQAFFLRIVQAVEGNRVADGSRIYDQIWRFKVLSEYNSKSSDEIFYSVVEAGRKWAIKEASAFDVFTVSYKGRQEESLGHILLRCWAANPGNFADHIAGHLCACPSHLSLGYSSWSGEGGTGTAAVAREAISAASGIWDDVTLGKVESVILKHSPEWEKSASGSRFQGREQHLLLNCLPHKRLSAPARKRFRELQRKFPHYDTRQPDPTGMARFVGSPIGNNALERMTDQQWLSAMRKYDEEYDRDNHGMEGGRHQLSEGLRRFCLTHKERFSELLLRMEDTLDPCYFAAILNGLSNQTVQGDNLPVEEQTNLPIGVLIASIRRVHSLPGHPCGDAICGAFQRAAKCQLPTDTLPVLCHYATDGSEIIEDTMDDLYQRGINTVRGNAALAIGNILGEHPNFLPELSDAIDLLVSDASFSVRSCAIAPLLSLLHKEPDFAVKRFVRVFEGAPPAFYGTPWVSSFLFYGLRDQFEHLEPILKRMLQCGIKDVLSDVGRLATLARLDGEHAYEIFRAAMAAGPNARRGATMVFAAKLQAPWREFCLPRLLAAFDDSDSSVRGEAAHVITKELVQNERGGEIVKPFLKSMAFSEHGNDLIWSLSEIEAPLPDYTLEVLEATVELLESAEGDPSRDIYFRAPELAIKCYYQVKGEPDKRDRVLACIDAFAKRQVLGMAEQLQEFDR